MWAVSQHVYTLFFCWFFFVFFVISEAAFKRLHVRSDISGMFHKKNAKL